MWDAVAVVANVVVGAAYLFISGAILVPLARGHQLRRNVLGTATGCIFATCSVGHLLHAEHAGRALVVGTTSGLDWHTALWDLVTAGIAVWYWSLRRLFPAIVSPGSLFRAEADRRYRTLVAHLPDTFVGVVDEDLRFEAVGGRVLGLIGRSDVDIVGRRWTDLGLGPMPAPGDALVVPTASGDVVLDVSLVGLPAADGGDQSLLVARDVTEHRRSEERLTRLAQHDPLTGLANRAHFHERLERALLAAKSEERGVAVLFLDLDGFKLVNDSFGHAVGDRVLQEAASRLVGTGRAEDVVGRMGGDEFTVLLDGPTSQAEAIGAAERICAALSAPIALAGTRLVVTTSVGIALSPPGETTTAEDLLRRADTALYQAKSNGGHRWEVYDPSFLRRALDRIELEAELREAMADEQLEVHYQPQICLATGRMVGVEALVRWRHPTRGLLLPSTFLPVALESGLMVAVGRFVLARACTDASRWSERLHGVRVGVNLCEDELAAPGLLEAVVRALDSSGLRPRQLCIEVNEQALLEVHGASATQLHRLEDLGVDVSVDDFGTGATSLTHLTRFKVDEVKVDRSFVVALGDDDPRAGLVVEAVIALAHALGARVVAEGAETPEQIELLRRMGCDVLQGYLVGAVVAADVIDDLVVA